MYVVVFDEKDNGVEVDADRYTRDEQYRAQVDAALRFASRLESPELQEVVEVAITELIRVLATCEPDPPEPRAAPFGTSRLQ